MATDPISSRCSRAKTARRCLGRLPSLLGCAALAAAGICQAATLRFEEGTARIPGQNAAIYREKHWTRIENDIPSERLVLYVCPDGTPFGRKFVDYRASQIAPEFSFTDSRSGYREGLRRVGGLAKAWFRDARQPEQQASLGVARLVVDAGFDNFIRSQWTELSAGRTVSLSFAVPARLRSLDFKLRRVGSADIGGQGAQVFRLSLGGWLGLIAPHIDVAYGQQSRRLLRFEGLSNLRDDAGRKQLVARIDFPTRDQSATDADWQAANSLPLAACRVRG